MLFKGVLLVGVKIHLTFPNGKTIVIIVRSYTTMHLVGVNVAVKATFMCSA